MHSDNSSSSSSPRSSTASKGEIKSALDKASVKLSSGGSSQSLGLAATGTGHAGSSGSSTKLHSMFNAGIKLMVPTYKSRAEEFRKLFKDVPEGDRFVIDYSCALQKDILVHGRMYLSFQHICFHANILKWETCFSINFKDVTAITKEKTAKVIPNAIQIVDKAGQKYFFSTFSFREKTFLILFKLWQHSLLDEPVNLQQLWSWAQDGYGDEDGASTCADETVMCTLNEANENDEGDIPIVQIEDTSSEISGELSHSPLSDDIQPVNRRERLEAGTAERQISWGGRNGLMEEAVMKKRPKRCHSAAVPLKSLMAEGSPPRTESPSKRLEHQPKSHDPLSRSSDSSELSDNGEQDSGCSCSEHHGKELLNRIYPVSADQMFLILFTDSPCYRDLMTARSCSNVIIGEWLSTTQEDAAKCRELTYTVALNHPMGPKSSSVSEKQTVSAGSKSGRLYIIKCEVQNHNIPYSDTFFVLNTFCISRVSAAECRLRIHGAPCYRRSCWGVVKTFIDKNVHSGLEEYFGLLNQHVQSECNRLVKGVRRSLVKEDLAAKSPKKKRKRSGELEPGSMSPTRASQPVIPVHMEYIVKAVLAVLIMMLLLNAFLFYKLWWIEEEIRRGQMSAADTFAELPRQIDMLMQNENLSKEDWIRLFSSERRLYRNSITKWIRSLDEVVKMIDKAEKSMEELKREVRSTQLHHAKVLFPLETLNDAKDSVDEMSCDNSASGCDKLDSD